MKILVSPEKMHRSGTGGRGKVKDMVTTFLEFLETWKCQRILHMSGKRHKVRER